MKFTAITATVAALFAAVTAQSEYIVSPDRQLNISSPLMNGVYVAGQILPFIYTPTVVPSNVQLNVYLRSMTGVFPEQIVAQNANVAADPLGSVPINIDNIMYYKHSINYPIPSYTPAGAYEAVYTNLADGISTIIPIVIQPGPQPSSSRVVASSAPATAAPATAAATPSASASASSAPAASASPAKSA
ncbi:hypothetical protein BDF20DRAFT_837476 [Mycotypha africana]|uniref:uncharacterized protein n=1 Tax=Mycotypha africana TaxID=64632 RepID=UPI0023018696|nr:uncharacterized protein BDF20DRAFT_837476 [Mycotypha africana]KAI8973538.1 hypothetical protein BDF20DRAFT_837476 [Mycotypha africana]